VSWSSRKQSNVTQSTTEAEYVAATSCCSQLLWITYTMRDFGEEYTHVSPQCDSTSAISVAKNPMLHSKTKQIEMRYHFLRDNVEKGKIALIHVPTHDQLADIFTEPIDKATFTRLRAGGGGGWCLFVLLCWCVGVPLSYMYSFPFCISCIWHDIGNMTYRHLCILGCMHFVSYAFVRKNFSYIHCSPWNDMYVFVSLFGELWLVWLSC
jgi:hypothetical protein